VASGSQRRKRRLSAGFHIIPFKLWIGLLVAALAARDENFVLIQRPGHAAARGGKRLTGSPAIRCWIADVVEIDFLRQVEQAPADRMDETVCDYSSFK